ncbi:hypothetical protein EYS09_14380 [Streptomyces kasugaensis]|uniref:Uncharacterized protein n=1 Tax=Streptomyces kasugaensis TaxID=1946 RepID=A0A4Q9HV50_STRKA|nr:hypothetical protein [Streptomyces kasugaensis]TBO59026.1 hypothetical protein EYS09_14380 [Streptomyces kasugaensis]
MNRNKRNPDRAPHRRRATAGNSTKNIRGYRITGSWDQRPERPAVKPTQDRKAMRRIARDMAERGAYVIVEQHCGYGRWETLYQVNGPALLAEQRVTEQAQRVAAEQAARAAAEAERARLAVEQRAERQLAALARLMVRPPVARGAYGRREARHVTGAQR